MTVSTSVPTQSFDTWEPPAPVVLWPSYRPMCFRLIKRMAMRPCGASAARRALWGRKISGSSPSTVIRITGLCLSSTGARSALLTSTVSVMPQPLSLMYKYVPRRLDIPTPDLVSNNTQVVFSLLHRLQRIGKEKGRAVWEMDGQWKAYPLEVCFFCLVSYRSTLNS